MEKCRNSQNSHPIKMKKLVSQRKLQHLSRNEQSTRAIKHHNELMETHNTNIGQVCNKLKKIRGDNIKNIEIPFIETLAGKFSGENVLEGFCSNTEILCNDLVFPFQTSLSPDGIIGGTVLL